MGANHHFFCARWRFPSSFFFDSPVDRKPHLADPLLFFFVSFKNLFFCALCRCCLSFFFFSLAWSIAATSPRTQVCCGVGSRFFVMGAYARARASGPSVSCLRVLRFFVGTKRLFFSFFLCRRHPTRKKKDSGGAKPTMPFQAHIKAIGRSGRTDPLEQARRRRVRCCCCYCCCCLLLLLLLSGDQSRELAHLRYHVATPATDPRMDAYWS
ncbi:hypothetical protein TW95_gp0426 [Pandoravirus inopinatum]|uniref:Transmembrane protein n=1 Tax=Pandoravirus inopinatum TaxID=1605721 RepID=A0A0B5J640_9VIRU|nr:hypothetical protein TW95_gp0426 [Pandoravirus inopinatum]AJF97160.1 hypothetical protein [Pandoravirus inopinatum]